MSTGLKSSSFVLFNYLQSNQIQHVVQVHAFLESREQGIGPKEAKKEEGIAPIDWKGRIWWQGKEKKKIGWTGKKGRKKEKREKEGRKGYNILLPPLLAMSTIKSCGQS